MTIQKIIKVMEFKFEPDINYNYHYKVLFEIQLPQYEYSFNIYGETELNQNENKTTNEIIELTYNNIVTKIDTIIQNYLQNNNLITPGQIYNPTIPEPPIIYPAWVQPLGAHDCYAIGAIVTHNNKIWKNTINCNVWVPGVYGWVIYVP